MNVRYVDDLNVMLLVTVKLRNESETHFLR